MSYNHVPPPPELIEKQNPKKVQVMVVGTSLCNRSLDKLRLEAETNTVVEKKKLFTISGGQYRADLNLVEKLTPEVCEQFQMIIIETGVNEIREGFKKKSGKSMVFYQTRGGGGLLRVIKNQTPFFGKVFFE